MFSQTLEMNEVNELAVFSITCLVLLIGGLLGGLANYWVAGPLQPGEQASAGIVNNLRSLIALGDSRFALIPVELSFARKGAQVVPTLRLVLLDGRSGQVAWFGDVAGRPGTGFAAAELGALAQRVADLVAVR